MARFGLWVAALSLVCLIAVVTSQSDSSNTQNSNEADITATCKKFFDVDSKMCANTLVNMVFNNYMPYFKEMNPDHVRSIMQKFDNDKDNFLNLVECQNFVNYIIQNAPNTNTK